MPPLSHPVFGVLNWDERLQVYTAENTLPDAAQVVLQIVDVNEENADLVVEQAAQTFVFLKKREWEIRQATVNALLSLYNDTWRDEEEDEEPINADTFAQRITLTAITFFLDGSAEIYYDDGDLFAQHTIVTGVNASGEFQSANLAG